MQVRSLKEQYQIQDAILQEKLTTIVGPLMQECGIDVWLIPSKEYNEDPLFTRLTPSGYPTARRLTILVLAQQDGKLTAYSISMPDQALNVFYQASWDRSKESQMSALIRLLTQLNPTRIGLNYSADYAYCDGLSVGLMEYLRQELPGELTQRFVSAEQLGISVLETRSPLEEQYWPEVMEVALDIIEAMYSRITIKPGQTTCADLEWFMMEQVNQRGLTCWFSPTLDLQRADGMHGGDTVILEGDLLHCDFGIVYLGLCTDTQRLAYVRKRGETAVPAELAAGMKVNNQFQDLVCAEFQAGRSGNAVFTAALQAAEAAGIKAMLYTHPLGMHGHAAGPTIGLYSDQHPQPVKGDLLIHDHTGYALELNTASAVAGYAQPVIFFTEESVLFRGGRVTYLAGGRETIMEI